MYCRYWKKNTACILCAWKSGTISRFFICCLPFLKHPLIQKIKSNVLHFRFKRWPIVSHGSNWWRSVADPGISKREGARSRRGRIFRSGVSFDAPSHIPYVFVARVVNKIHNVNIVYWQKSKYMRVIQSKFTKTNLLVFSKRGARARPAGPGSAFVNYSL